jgi:phosphohistidine phosphatase SixA
MKLLLCRHSIQSANPKFFDAERSLTAEGIELEKKTIGWIEKFEIVPKLVVTSPMQRAKETGALISDHFHCPCVVEEALSYDFDESRIRQLIAEEPVDTLCLVGHGPFISEFAQSLAQNVAVPEIHRASALLFSVDTSKVPFQSKPLLYFSPQGATPIVS